MTTKSRKTVTTIKPIVRFYISEDLRVEVNGKVSPIGLYPDNVVVVLVPDNAPTPTESKPIFMKSLSFLFNVSNLAKPTRISIDIEANGKRRSFMNAKEYPAPGLGNSFNMVGTMEPCPITSFGEKTLIVKVGDLVQKFNFEIRRGSLPNTKKMTEKNADTSKISKSALPDRKKTKKAT